MTNLGELHGVKNRPSHTPGGLKVVSVKYAPIHKMYFAIAKRPNRDHYIIERLKKTGEFAKKTPEALWSSDWECEGQAKDALWLWDSGLNLDRASE